MNSPFTDQLSTDQINQTLILEHERNRRTLWINVAAAYAAASNSTDREGMARWSNLALQKFDEKFPTPPQISTP